MLVDYSDSDEDDATLDATKPTAPPAPPAPSAPPPLVPPAPMAESAPPVPPPKRPRKEINMQALLQRHGQEIQFEQKSQECFAGVCQSLPCRLVEFAKTSRACPIPSAFC